MTGQSMMRIGAFCLTLGSATLGCLAVQASEKEDQFSKQFRFLDSRGASQYANSARLLPRAAWDTPLDLSAPTGGNAALRRVYLPLAQAAARRHGIPETLFARLVQQESNWDPNAVSPKGALGLAQLLPSTARHLGVDPAIPDQNLDGGARYLRTQYERFGSWRLALAAYNAGPEAVARHNGVPPYPETQNYVQVILSDNG